MTIAERMLKIRVTLNASQKEMAEMVGVTRDTWRRYENGFTPTGEPLERLIDLGFSADWVLAGRGEMKFIRDILGLSEDPVSFEHTPIDPELMGRIVDAIAKLYKEENVRIAPVDQGRLAAEIYSGVDFIADEAERLGAVRYIIQTKRAELRRTPSNDGTTKRQA